MRILEEPFVPVHTLTALDSRGPYLGFLRGRRALSRGIAVLSTRQRLGRVGKSLRIFSALNLDALRAFRHGFTEEGRYLAEEASTVERSEPARYLAAAVEDVASEILRSTSDSLVWWASVPPLLKYQQAQRREVDPYGADEWTVLTSWLSRSAAWLEHGDHETLKVALQEVAAHTSKARSDARAASHPRADAFLGVILRMDRDVAEVRSEDGVRRLVARRELAREGLALVGQAVAVSWDPLPGGINLWRYAAAVQLESPGRDDSFSPYEGPTATLLMRDEADWLQRILSSEPTVLPLGPLPVPS